MCDWNGNGNGNAYDRGDYNSSFALRAVELKSFLLLYNNTCIIFTVKLFVCIYTFHISRPRKSWDEVIKNDRKKLDMDSADPQNHSEWRGRLRGRLVKKPNPR